MQKFRKSRKRAQKFTQITEIHTKMGRFFWVFLTCNGHFSVKILVISNPGSQYRAQYLRYFYQSTTTFHPLPPQTPSSIKKNHPLLDRDLTSRRAEIPQ